MSEIAGQFKWKFYDKWKNKTELSSHKGTIEHNSSIYMENDKGNGLNVHILELVLNERAQKIYFPNDTIILHC